MKRHALIRISLPLLALAVVSQATAQKLPATQPLAAHSPAGTHGGGNGGDAEAADFKRVLLQSVAQAKASGKQEIAGVSVKAIEKALARTVVVAVPATEALTAKVHGSDATVPTHFANFPDARTIKFHDGEWDKLPRDEFKRRQFALHELLPIAGVADWNYVTSFNVATELAGLRAAASPASGPVPAGWTELSPPAGRYPSLYVAIGACERIADPYLDEYEKVVCEPYVAREKETLRWSEAHDTQSFVGFAVSRSNSSSSSISSFAGSLLGVFMESYDEDHESSSSYDETPVFETRPVAIELFREEMRDVYSYRILGRTPLAANPQAEETIYESVADQMRFATPQSASQACFDVMLDMKRAGFAARCKIDQDPADALRPYTYRIIGKKKFVRAGS